MGIIGREIIQSRIWPNEMIERTGNYKEVFPITVFDAVFTEIGSNVNLTSIIDQMQRIISTHQTKLPAKGADQLVTYAGHEGEVGSIGITTNMDINEPSNDLIPTEKAVAKYLVDLGFVDQEGNVNTNQKIRWSNIINRPKFYSTIGQNEDGFMTQRSITDQINLLINRINGIDLADDVAELGNIISDHIENQYNPHHVTLAQLDGVSTEAFTNHTENTNNPHNVTKAQLGLGNVDNTSDLNKPISTAVQNKFNLIDDSINSLIESTDQFTIINTKLQTLDEHLIDFDNPHQVTLAQLNGVSLNSFSDHINNYGNPHQVTKAQVGLSNVDNTSDINKPISTAAQNKFNLIDADIAEIQRIQSLQITTEQIEDGAITEDKIADESISTDKIQVSDPNTVLISTGEEIIWDKINNSLIQNNSINGAKIVNKSITVDQIADANIDSSKLAADIVLYGNPTRLSELDLDDDSNSLTTSEWVNAQNFGTDRIIDRSITGDKLFTTSNDNTVLSVIESNSSPIYSKINHSMLNDNIIETNNIKNLNVTENKIADDSISTIKIKDDAILTNKIIDDAIITDKILDEAVTSDKIFKATDSGLVLMSDNNLKPVYTQLTEDHIQFSDHSIPISKLESIDQPDRILAVITNNTDPIWTKVNSDMLRDKIVDGSKLFTSPVSNRVLAVETMYEDAFYTQVNTEMIKDDAITSDKIADGTISYNHLSSELIGSDFIETSNIKDESVTGDKIFRSALSNRVLGTIGNPYDPPQWTQVNTGMIADEAVNGDKLWMSGIIENPYRVIGVTGPDVPPEYLMITGDFIVNYSVPGNKLVSNIQLSGSPTIENNPPANSRDHSIPTTGWVATVLDNFQSQIDQAITNLSGSVATAMPSITEEDLDDMFDEVWPLSNNSGEDGSENS